MSVYRVIGARRYREHQPGDIFEADLEPAAEARAIRFGAIELVDRRRTTIRPGSAKPPKGWQHTNDERGPA